jgi:acetyltransferase-like isoleucine patch superfamily enzyme
VSLYQIKQAAKKVVYSQFLLCAWIRHVLFRNSIKLLSMQQVPPSVVMKRTKLNDNGKNNRVTIGEHCHLIDCRFLFFGSHNHVSIGDKCHLNQMTIWIEDANNSVYIGSKSTINGQTKLACIEGCSIIIGDDCMFSEDIIARTGDSHSILNATGTRTNVSKDIVIGNHVWIGQQVILGKGVCVPNNSIVGAGSVVTKQFMQDGIIIAGNPARLVKENISWTRERTLSPHPAQSQHL